MSVLISAVLAAVVALIGYGAFDLGGSVTAIIFLTLFATGAFIVALQTMFARGE